MPTAPRSRRLQNHTTYEHQRGTAQERGYDKAWRARCEALRIVALEEPLSFLCRYCERNEFDRWDHANPPSRHGRPGSTAYLRWFNDDTLLIPCCKRCNDQKSNLLPEELKKAFPVIYKRMMTVLKERGVEL